MGGEGAVDVEPTTCVRLKFRVLSKAWLALSMAHGYGMVTAGKHDRLRRRTL